MNNQHYMRKIILLLVALLLSTSYLAAEEDIITRMYREKLNSMSRKERREYERKMDAQAAFNRAVSKFLSENPDLPEYEKKIVQSGMVGIGLSKKSVRFLMGEPLKVRQEKKPWAVQEIWEYKRDRKKIHCVFEDGHLAGWQ